MASVGFDGDQASLQESFIITDGVHGGHDRVDGTVPREDGHLHRTFKDGLDGVEGHACVLQGAVTVGALHGGFKDVVDFVGGQVGERRVSVAFPMGVEHRL